MSRMPYNVHIVLFRRRMDGPQFAVFKRVDIENAWQGVCGGGESGESIGDAALRECFEEAGVEHPSSLYPLDSVGSMRSDVFPEWTDVWGQDVLVLPMYHFALEYDREIRLSEEHTDINWLTFDETLERVRFADQALAFWELNERLKRGNLERPIPQDMKNILNK